MMTALEELQEEVVGELHTLTRENLLGVCDFLNISGERRENVEGKSRISLVTHVMKYLEREEVAELEDDGMSELLLLKDKIAGLAMGTDNGAVQTEENVERAGTQREIEEQRTVKQCKGVETEQSIPVNAAGYESQCQSQPTVSPPVSMQPPVSAQLQQPSPCWRKDFKISGQIGEAGQKDKLTFSSLAHQIENGLNRGYPEIEIVDAVIRAISPGSQLRSYLEGKPHLTLPTLRRILRSHFQEKSATELYKQLASEAQNSKDTPQTFLMQVLDLRQKVLFASQESESGLKYDPALVQRMCLHTLLTGLQNESIRIDMQPLLLDTETSDELLLERLNVACANEAERRNKRKLSNQQSATSVSVVQSEDRSPAKCSVKETKTGISPELLTEIQELKTGVASLKGLSAEIAQIKETLHQTRFQPQSYAPPAVRPDRDPQPSVSPQQYYSSYNQPQTSAPMRPQYGPNQYTNHSVRAPRRCFVCQQTGANERCMHCYRCGSGEHFQAGCKIRGIRPSREAPLNREWLPPRDGC